MTSKVLIEKRDGILEVTVNRPEAMNAFDSEVHQTLDACWTDYEADPSLRVAIITGAGDRAFSAGSDLKYYASGKPIVLPDSGYGGLSHRRLNKPLIAAVNGMALGGGFEFALCCDLIIASEGASFGLPEVRVGAAALGGGIPRICRKLPFNLAMGLILSARRMSAAEAYRLGLVNELVPPGQLMDAARAWAADIVLGAPIAVEVSKEIAINTLYGLEDMDAPPGDSRDPRAARVLNSADCLEGMRAFAEKRAPVWKGC